MEVETADLISHTQMVDREEAIDKLLLQLGDANRNLIDAVESDERKHTIERAGV